MSADVYLKFDGIDGESTDKEHKKWIEIDSFNFGLHQSISPGGSGTSGLTAGRVNYSDISVSKTVDAASPKLYLYCSQGQHIKEVTFQFCEASGEKHQYLEYKLTDALISSVSTSAGGGGRVMEQVSIAFSKIQWKYSQLDDKGKKVADIEGGWDMAENVKV